MYGNLIPIFNVSFSRKTQNNNNKNNKIMKYFNRERCINNILKHDCLNFTRHFLEGFTDEDLRECELEVVYGWI